MGLTMTFPVSYEQLQKLVTDQLKGFIWSMNAHLIDAETTKNDSRLTEQQKEDIYVRIDVALGVLISSHSEWIPYMKQIVTDASLQPMIDHIIERFDTIKRDKQGKDD